MVGLCNTYTNALEELLLLGSTCSGQRRLMMTFLCTIWYVSMYSSFQGGVCTIKSSSLPLMTQSFFSLLFSVFTPHSFKITKWLSFIFGCQLWSLFFGYSFSFFFQFYYLILDWLRIRLCIFFSLLSIRLS